MLSRLSIPRGTKLSSFVLQRRKVDLTQNGISSWHWHSNTHLNRCMVSAFSTTSMSHSIPCSSIANNHFVKTKEEDRSRGPPKALMRHQLQQSRTFAGRKDRYSASFKSRPPTKKQRKAYHRRQRKLDYEATKHAPPMSKAGPRLQEERERQEKLVEIAKEEEQLKDQLFLFNSRVDELQKQIKASDKFKSMKGKANDAELKEATKLAAIQAAAKEGITHPPLPSWWQERLTYDWGDALVDDLMGNSADLTSSPNPHPVFMGGEYARIRRKVERVLRQIDDHQLIVSEYSKRYLSSGDVKIDLPNNGLAGAQRPSKYGKDFTPTEFDLPPPPALSDKLLSDLLRSYRDFKGTRTNPLGLTASLHLLFADLDIARSSLGTYSYVSLLTCCKSPLEARKVNQMRKEDGVRSNAYFWSAFVDVYARSGDYRGAEEVLDEMLEETKKEHEKWLMVKKSSQQTDPVDNEEEPPITIPPLPAYTSFLSACHKLLNRPDVHPSIKSDAAKRAWQRWKEMRIHGVPPDAMAYGALMRVFAAQGRAEKAVDLLEEIMGQLMLPVSAEGIGMVGGKGVVDGTRFENDVLRSVHGDIDGWYDDSDGNRVHVKPTTLIFTSALKAVARSHEIATRFSRGKSKKNRRRESIAAYHGKLARKIVILAEQAEVEQDDGFVSALMLCAAAAGDSSTARAIYLGSRVRRMDHLRTCGGKDHLRRLQGLVPEDDQLMIGQGDASPPVSSEPANSESSSDLATPASSIRSIEEEYFEQHQAYEHREYGADTRILSTLLLAHSKAMESQGLGSIWAGQFNRGYLCENSLRWIEAYNRPGYENLAIPGLTPAEAGLSETGWEPEDFSDDNSKRLRKKKLNMKSIIGDGHGNQIGDLDPMLHDLIESEKSDREEMNNRLQQNASGSDIGRDWLHDKLALARTDDQDTLHKDPATTINVQENQQPKIIEAPASSHHSESQDFRFGEKNDHISELSGRDDLFGTLAHPPNDPELEEGFKRQDIGNAGDQDDVHFDEEKFQEFFNMNMEGFHDSNEINEEDISGDADELYDIPGVATNNFQAFRSHLKKELEEEGATHDVDEAEARNLFDMMRTYFINDNPKDDLLQDADFLEEDLGAYSDKPHLEGRHIKTVTNDENNLETNNPTFSSSFLDEDEHGSIINDNNEFSNATPAKIQEKTHKSLPDRKTSYDLPKTTTQKETMFADDYASWADQLSEELSYEDTNTSEDKSKAVTGLEQSNSDAAAQNKSMSLASAEDFHLVELQQALPGLSRARIEKVSNEFSRVLGYPSILRLSLALRESMPDDLPSQWLVRKNLLNAEFVMSEATKEDLVDIHVLNAMLQVKTNSGRIDPAIRFHHEEFKKHGITPSTHSDRLLLQMLIKHKRLSRAFKLKETIENEGRTLDLLSYGSLVEHFGNRQQLGSALLLIKECIAVHGLPPGEKSLKNIRLFCRKRGLIDQIGLEEMIGEDPVEWLRHGQKYLKREKSKKGWRDVHYAKNRLLDI